uniref:Calpain 12 n=1 Tax=Astatotilapia calliptera TaxID=8154 RepID=A0A3P8Q3N1_ASTCA
MDNKLQRSKAPLAPCYYSDSRIEGPPGAPHTFPGWAEPGRRSSSPRLIRAPTDTMATNNEAPLGSTENPIKFKDQDFETLQAECLKSGVLFSDPTFPAEQKSIGTPEDPDPKKAIQWKRPKEISKNAVFVEDTTATTDICQGQLGNCWLLAALSCLTAHPSLFMKVVPPNQSLSDRYAGIFHFKFWQYGEWVEVVVDDRLPVREGRLLFSYSRTRNEFWSALVEKAYAKLIGSYGSLKGGNISEGMEDFTGGIARSLEISSRTPRVLWRSLAAALSRGSLLSCFIQAKSASDIGKVTGEGLIKGHAYAITDADKLTKPSDEILLLRLRNPWGFIEYCGPWSDKGKEWENVDPTEKERIEVKCVEDGEFWISAEDFSNLFDVVELCSVNPDSYDEESTPASWAITEHEGCWLPGSSAGGSRKYNKTFWKNPQYTLVLKEKDENEDEDDDDDVGDDGEDGDDEMEDPTVTPDPKKRAEKQKQKVKRCTVLVELLQKNRRQRDKLNFLHIAFHIYKVLYLSSFNVSNRPACRSGKYKGQRGVWRKMRLDPGTYVIVVSTYRPNIPGEFFVRTFSKIGNTLDMFIFVLFFYQVMTAPVSSKDQERVEMTFDKQAVLEKDYHLPLETCRELIFGEDTKGRCALSREQAGTLLASVRNLQSIFSQFDEDSSGSMSRFELSSALQAVGFQCDNKVVELLSERFTSGELDMPFHGFLSCVTRLRKLFEG